MLGFGLAHWLVLLACVAVYQAVYVWLQAIVGWSFGAHVTEIAVGYFPVVRFRCRGASCRLGLLPIAGYTNFWGMEGDDKPPPDLPEGAQPLRALHPLKRILLFAVGPLSCLFIGFGAIFAVEWVGRTEPVFLGQAPVIAWCPPGSRLALAGLEEGDVITAVTVSSSGITKTVGPDGVARPSTGDVRRVDTWRELIGALAATSNQFITIDAIRAGEPVVFQNRLEHCALFDVSHQTPETFAGTPESKVADAGSPFSDAIADTRGMLAGIFRAYLSLQEFGTPIHPPDNGYRRLSFLRFTTQWSSVGMAIGVVGIFQCVMNLLPLPFMNGGRILLTTWDWATGQALSDSTVVSQLGCLGLAFFLLFQLKVLICLTL